MDKNTFFTNESHQVNFYQDVKTSEDYQKYIIVPLSKYKEEKKYKEAMAPSSMIKVKLVCIAIGYFLDIIKKLNSIDNFFDNPPLRQELYDSTYYLSIYAYDVIDREDKCKRYLLNPIDKLTEEQVIEKYRDINPYELNSMEPLDRQSYVETKYKMYEKNIYDPNLELARKIIMDAIARAKNDKKTRITSNSAIMDCLNNLIQLVQNQQKHITHSII